MVVLLCSLSLSHNPQSTPPQVLCAASERCRRKVPIYANFLELRQREVRRIPLPRTPLNKVSREVRYFPVEVCPFACLFVPILCAPDLQHRHLAFLASRSGAPTS